MGRKKMKALVSAALLGVLTLGGCGQSGESQYLGKWVSVKNEQRKLEIVENGDAYLVKITNPRSRGRSETDSFPAAVKDGIMTFSFGLGEMKLAVDQSTGHLTGAGEEFVRPK
jgi:hypothetical protein